MHSLGRWRRFIAGALLLILIPGLAWLAAASLRVIRLDPESENRAAALFDMNGNLIATLGTRKQAYVPLTDISPEMRNAIIAIEDARFFQHPGVDIKGIVRAIWVDLKRGTRAQGASTITQQLARTLFLSPEKTMQRKIAEALLALLLELRYSKGRILEMYLNTIYFGEGAYGIEDAALTYFGKSASELTLAEATLLASLPKAPSTLSPYRNPERALERRHLVLQRMVDLGYVTQEQADAATDEPLRLAGLRGGLAPYFVDHVTAELVARYGSNTVYRGGLRVHTTLDLEMQTAAHDALGQSQGAIVAIDPTTGAIRAMVGGRDYMESQFNRATQAVRQPGSAFKPFVYAAALERGLPMNYVLVDHPGDFNGYRPENFKGEYWGAVTMKFAMTRSLNTASVRLLKQIGVGAAIEMAQRLGIDTLLLPDDRNLALALGGLTKGVTPLAMTAAYAVFANGGLYYEPYSIEQVFDNRGRLLSRHQSRPRRVLDEETAYLVTNMLQSVVEQGTGRAANIGRPQAGKTGTTNNTLSAWFAGYTPQLVATVYVGHDTHRPLGLGGGSLAAPIWGKFAAAALRDVPAQGFAVPAGIQTNIPIDPFTGHLAGAQCQLQERDAFTSGTIPTQVAPCYWNAAAQPEPYRIGVAQSGELPSSLASLPGGLFGDDPAQESPLLPAGLLYPLGLSDLSHALDLPWLPASDEPVLELREELSEASATEAHAWEQSTGESEISTEPQVAPETSGSLSPLPTEAPRMVTPTPKARPQSASTPKKAVTPAPASTSKVDTDTAPVPPTEEAVESRPSETPVENDQAETAPETAH